MFNASLQLKMALQQRFVTSSIPMPFVILSNKRWFNAACQMVQAHCMSFVIGSDRRCLSLKDSSEIMAFDALLLFFAHLKDDSLMLGNTRPPPNGCQSIFNTFYLRNVTYLWVKQNMQWILHKKVHLSHIRKIVFMSWTP